MKTASVFCQWQESESLWTCSQCGAQVAKAAIPSRPLAACRVGADANGIPFRSIADARRDPKVFERLTTGPGTELKKLLAAFGIRATDTCPCNQYAVQMNVWGPDQCESRIEQIVQWLRDEAARRHLPFAAFAARRLIKLAIRNARRATDDTPAATDGRTQTPGGPDDTQR